MSTHTQRKTDDTSTHKKGQTTWILNRYKSQWNISIAAFRDALNSWESPDIFRRGWYVRMQMSEWNSWLSRGFTAMNGRVDDMWRTENWIKQKESTYLRMKAEPFMQKTQRKRSRELVAIRDDMSKCWKHKCVTSAAEIHYALRSLNCSGDWCEHISPDNLLLRCSKRNSELPLSENLLYLLIVRSRAD